jgi:hypothetical protein
MDSSRDHAPDTCALRPQEAQSPGECVDFEEEGSTPHAEAGVDLADLIARGWLDGVTDAHREKARKYWAKIDFARSPKPMQGNLFGDTA